MVGVVPLLYLGYKLIKPSPFYKSEQVDLVKNLDEIEEYEANYVPQPAKYDAHPYSLHCQLANECYRNWFERSLDFLFG